MRRKRDWYFWRDGRDGGAAEQLAGRASAGRPGRSTRRTGQWYLHLFLPQQPDLNWGNPAVVAAMHDVLRFWLDRGVDGFRIDVVHLIGKDPALARPAGRRSGSSTASAFTTTRVRTSCCATSGGCVDSYPGERVMVGEVEPPRDGGDPRRTTAQRDELHLAFNFLPLSSSWTAAAWRRADRDGRARAGRRGAWPTWVLSNHDTRRHRTR